MWIYAQKTGALLRHGQLIGQGYSGFDLGRNNPEMQATHDIGPIPQGEWIIIGPPFNSTAHGPFILKLDPAPVTNTFGRSGFLMHGDSVSSPGTASKGCIVMPRSVREHVWNTGDRYLAVVAECATQDAIRLHAPDSDAEASVE